jgi:CRISPR system Cascade subunit CasD
MSANTLFLRLEGPMQAWGTQESKFVIRRTAEAPTKSGVIGLLCAALGISRQDAPDEWLPKLASLRMGVRIDMPGIRWWDYHTVGAEMEMQTAENKTKKGAMLTRREYLCDASFLVVLQGESSLIAELFSAIKNPTWTLYLGRKNCPPSRPLIERETGLFPDILSALSALPYRPRLINDKLPKNVDCFLDWIPTNEEPDAPTETQVWYDVPLTFAPPAHYPRFVIHTFLTVSEAGEVNIDEPVQNKTPEPLRSRANYQNSEYKKARTKRLNDDYGLCIFCKSPATTVQHITYKRAGGNESQDDLRSLCRLCHDAVTMIEYGLNMGMERINPEEIHWRDEIIKKRQEIIKFRSIENRRRSMKHEELD